MSSYGGLAEVTQDLSLLTGEVRDLEMEVERLKQLIAEQQEVLATLSGVVKNANVLAERCFFHMNNPNP